MQGGNVLAEKYQDRIEKAFSKYPDKRSAVMPVLYIAQEEYGYITPEALEEVAAICQMTPTQVKSIAGFYTMYFKAPRGKYHFMVCTDLPCALRGSEAFLQVLKEYLGVEENEVTGDGLFSVEHVMCLAACDKAPMMQVYFQPPGETIRYSYCEGLDIDKAKSIIDTIRQTGEYHCD